MLDQEKITIEEFENLKAGDQKSCAFHKIECFTDTEVDFLAKKIGTTVREVSNMYGVDFDSASISKGLRDKIGKVMEISGVKFKKDNERRWKSNYSVDKIKKFPLRTLSALLRNSKAREAFLELEGKGIKLVGDLSRCSESFLLRSNGFGKPLIFDLQKLIKPWGVSLASETGRQSILNRKAAELEKMIRDMKKEGGVQDAMKVLQDAVLKMDEIILGKSD